MEKRKIIVEVLITDTEKGSRVSSRVNIVGENQVSMTDVVRARDVVDEHFTKLIKEW